LSSTPANALEVVGPNGAGKTTLLRILAGSEEPTAGRVVLRPTNARIGYLAQALEYEPHQTIGDVLAADADDLATTRRALHALEQQLTTANTRTMPEILATYDRVQQRFAALDGYSFVYRTEAVLAQVGLEQLSLETPVDQLSGGQQTRLGLACLLLADCQILLLDANHLDITALSWLETFLCKQDAAIVIVSHDRTFLDRVAQRILEVDIDTRRATEYAGNYSAYIATKQQDLAEQWRRYNEQQRYIERIEESIRRLSAHADHIEHTTTHIHRPMRQLSLGQRARLALAELVAAGCNLLLLDEPFNHLDAATREGIEHALKDFGGMVIAATHDRHFMSTSATRLWRLEEGRLLDILLSMS